MSDQCLTSSGINVPKWKAKSLPVRFPSSSHVTLAACRVTAWRTVNEWWWTIENPPHIKFPIDTCVFRPGPFVCPGGHDARVSCNEAFCWISKPTGTFSLQRHFCFRILGSCVTEKHKGSLLKKVVCAVRGEDGQFAVCLPSLFSSLTETVQETNSAVTTKQPRYLSPLPRCRISDCNFLLRLMQLAHYFR